MNDTVLPKHDHAFADLEGDAPDIKLWNEASVRAYAAACVAAERERCEQAYAQPRLFEDAKVGAGDTAVQGDMLLPANDLREPHVNLFPRPSRL